MLIYIFAEHYPNPYKPQFDTEFAFFIRKGHKIKIFVGGSYNSTIHQRVLSYDLHKKTFHVPTTLKTLPRFIRPLVEKIIWHPQGSVKRLRDIHEPNQGLKKNIMHSVRALMLPETPPDICYIHNIVTAGLFDFLNKVYPSSRFIMYFHGGEVGGVKHIVNDAELFGRMNIVFTNTKFSREQAIARGCSPNQVIVLPVGHVISDYPSSTQKNYREGGILRLISIGRLSEEKGIHFALESIASLVAKGYCKLRYTIVGRGTQEAFLKDFVRRKGLEMYVNFVGEQDKAGVVAQLENSDVLILPSVITESWAETQANVVQEAMFMRLLVITTKAGGVPESIPDIMQQFSVPIGDSTSIAKEILKILSLPESEMVRLGDAARNFTIEKYDIDKIGSKFLEYAMSDAPSS